MRVVYENKKLGLQITCFGRNKYHIVGSGVCRVDATVYLNTVRDDELEKLIKGIEYICSHRRKPVRFYKEYPLQYHPCYSRCTFLNLISDLFNTLLPKFKCPKYTRVKRQKRTARVEVKVHDIKFVTNTKKFSWGYTTEYTVLYRRKRASVREFTLSTFTLTMLYDFTEKDAVLFKEVYEKLYRIYVSFNRIAPGHVVVAPLTILTLLLAHKKPKSWIIREATKRSKRSEATIRSWFKKLEESGLILPSKDGRYTVSDDGKYLMYMFCAHYGTYPKLTGKAPKLEEIMYSK